MQILNKQATLQISTTITFNEVFNYLQLIT